MNRTVARLMAELFLLSIGADGGAYRGVAVSRAVLTISTSPTCR